MKKINILQLCLFYIPYFNIIPILCVIVNREDSIVCPPSGAQTFESKYETTIKQNNKAPKKNERQNTICLGW